VLETARVMEGSPAAGMTLEELALRNRTRSVVLSVVRNDEPLPTPGSDTRLLAGLESLYTPRLRRTPGEIEPLESEASEDQQDDAMRRLHAAMRDSLTVARANRFVEQLLPERKSSMPSMEIPLRCEEDLADLIACLLHAHASDATYRVEVTRERADANAAQYDSKLSYRIERFTLSRK